VIVRRPFSMLMSISERSTPGRSGIQHHVRQVAQITNYTEELTSMHTILGGSLDEIDLHNSLKTLKAVLVRCVVSDDFVVGLLGGSDGAHL
jgi:hypothetical protein